MHEMRERLLLDSDGTDSMPLLYADLAPWFHLLTHPRDYAEEAEIYRRHLENNGSRPPRTLLELGSGGGNCASHLKQFYQLTLCDLSQHMLDLSLGLNPNCEHVQGDMRTLRLDRLFDAVLIQDAVSYMTSIEDLRLAVKTAFVHCEPGAAALFCPDHTRETFKPSTSHGGHDAESPDLKALRYLEWNWDPDPDDSRYQCEFSILTRDERGRVRSWQDRHHLGLFTRDQWLEVLAGEGFVARMLPFEHSQVEGDAMLFLGVRPGLE